jgi:hypothetical protein
MEPVVTLGLSVLPNRTELVVLRGRDGQGDVLDRVVTATHDSASAVRSRLRQTVEAVLQTQALAVAHGYHVHAVGVMSDGANAPLTRWLIVALEGAGLENVTALDPAVAGEIFTRSATVEDGATTDRPRSRLRRRLIFIASVAIALLALAFAIVDRLAVQHPSRPTQPAPTPTVSSTTVETPPPAVPAPAPPSTPALEAPSADPPAPAYTPPAPRAPVQQQPAQPPRSPSPPPPTEPAEPAAPDNCMFLCGVTI